MASASFFQPPQSFATSSSGVPDVLSSSGPAFAVRGSDPGWRPPSQATFVFGAAETTSSKPTSTSATSVPGSFPATTGQQQQAPCLSAFPSWSATTKVQQHVGARDEHSSRPSSSQRGYYFSTQPESAPSFAVPSQPVRPQSQRQQRKPSSRPMRQHDRHSSRRVRATGGSVSDTLRGGASESGGGTDYVAALFHRLAPFSTGVDQSSGGARARAAAGPSPPKRCSGAGVEHTATHFASAQKESAGEAGVSNLLPKFAAMFSPVGATPAPSFQTESSSKNLFTAFSAAAPQPPQASPPSVNQPTTAPAPAFSTPAFSAGMPGFGSHFQSFSLGANAQEHVGSGTAQSSQSQSAAPRPKGNPSFAESDVAFRFQGMSIGKDAQNAAHGRPAMSSQPQVVTSRPTANPHGAEGDFGFHFQGASAAKDAQNAPHFSAAEPHASGPSPSPFFSENHFASRFQGISLCKSTQDTARSAAAQPSQPHSTPGPNADTIPGHSGVDVRFQGAACGSEAQQNVSSTDAHSREPKGVPPTAKVSPSSHASGFTSRFQGNSISEDTQKEARSAAAQPSHPPAGAPGPKVNPGVAENDFVFRFQGLTTEDPSNSQPSSSQDSAGAAAQGPTVASKLHENSLREMQSSKFTPASSFWFPSPFPPKTETMNSDNRPGPSFNAGGSIPQEGGGAAAGQPGFAFSAMPAAKGKSGAFAPVPGTPANGRRKGPQMRHRSRGSPKSSLKPKHKPSNGGSPTPHSSAGVAQESSKAGDGPLGNAAGVQGSGKAASPAQGFVFQAAGPERVAPLSAAKAAAHGHRRNAQHGHGEKTAAAGSGGNGQTPHVSNSTNEKPKAASAGPTHCERVSSNEAPGTQRSQSQATHVVTSATGQPQPTSTAPTYDGPAPSGADFVFSTARPRGDGRHESSAGGAGGLTSAGVTPGRRGVKTYRGRRPHAPSRPEPNSNGQGPKGMYNSPKGMEWSPEVPLGRASFPGSVFTEVGNSSRGSTAQQRQQPAQAYNKVERENKPQRPDLLAKCEKHRKAGNHAFQLKMYESAEAEYSEALVILAKNKSVSSSDLLAPLHSNRAAARLMLGKPVGAAWDCRAALHAQPTFVRASLRLSTALLRVGNFQYATACVASLLDRSDLEASRRDDVRRKVEEVSFVQRKADAAVGVLMSHRAGELSVSQLTELLSELEGVLKEASMSSALLAWKAEILLRLGNLEEAALVAGATQSDEEAEAGNSHSVWKWWVQAQVAWHKAELETALRLLGAGLEQLSTREAEMATSSACHFQLPSAPALSEAKENMMSLLVLKNSGNTAFMASKLAEAKEAYSKGLAANEMCSPAIAAVLHSNRAAVLHKEGSLLSALADCCRARALNPRYHKSYSRLAAILVDLHRPAEAVRVLEAMVENATLRAKERTDAEARIQTVRQKISDRNVADHYKLLGLARSCTKEEVRREYKKLALKYHPDKATSSMLPPALALCKGFALVAHDSDLSAWEARVRNEAEWVFKCIGEAHTILSDPVKRSSLDIKLDNMASRAGGRADATARPSSQAGRAHHGGGRANQYPSNWQHSHRATGRGGYRPQGSYGHYGKPPSYGFEWSDEDDDDFYSYSNY